MIHKADGIDNVVSVRKRYGDPGIVRKRERESAGVRKPLVVILQRGDVLTDERGQESGIVEEERIDVLTVEEFANCGHDVDVEAGGRRGRGFRERSGSTAEKQAEEKRDQLFHGTPSFL